MRVVILCGGSGSRLWPASRESLPKQFISIIDKKTLLDLSIERVLPLMKKNRPIFICNKNHSFFVKQSLEKYNLKADIFLEPEGRNTCAAIYLAAKHCSTNDKLLIMPSDHFIPDQKGFLKNISLIKDNFINNNWITFGIQPTKASEAYGYIKVIREKANKLFKVLKFIEKPSKTIAEKLILDKNYYWNAGIFIANSQTILNSIKKYKPKIADICDQNYNKKKVNEITGELIFCPKLFSKIPSISIDYAVMEHSNNIYLYPFNGKWNDVGSWDSFSEIIKMPTNNKKIIQVESKKNFIVTKNRTIATIGIEDLIIIDTDDATLITKKNHSEKVKQVVNKLIKRKLVEGKEHVFEYRPWGKFENLFSNDNCKVKRIIVSPKKRLSLQYHNFRSEHWLIVKGNANIHLDGIKILLKVGESLDIPMKSQHFIENKEETDLIFIETQLGSYFGEDDIVRLDDPYFR
jgi:mannose-1-phosphate guanylyltransferase/mannose-6-phosphate isomerase